jgi:hypothetical protein
MRSCGGFIVAFNLDDYEPVATRLSRWLDQCHQQNITPRVITHLVHYSDNRCVFRAELYANDILIATGWEEETRGEGMVNRTSHLANCETSAVGRALANAGLAGADPSRRASREEMAKVVRLQSVPTQEDIPWASQKQQNYIRALSKNLSTEQLDEILVEVCGKKTALGEMTPQQASQVIERLRK